MRILVSNDDGYFAPGIQALAEAMSQLGEVTVVAPDRNRSGASNSLTLDNPLRVSQRDNGYYSVTGTPTDCIHLGTHEIMKEQPDIVVAGVNHGANLGDDVLYSGTVAAAMEGRTLGLPSVAVSLVGLNGTHFDTAARFVARVVERFKTHPLPAREILNINVPDLPPEKIAGVEVTRCGSRHRANTIVADTDQKNRPIYWLGPPAEGDDTGPGTDFHAVMSGKISITPLHIDFTAHRSLPAMGEWAKGLE